MNYLAHAYLSFNQPSILAGNMISDFVKGRKQYNYSAAIQSGIRLHRAIDHFTDTHPATKQLQSFFRADYRLYSGAFADVVYDHFLATDTIAFADEKALKDFSTDTYALLYGQIHLLPENFTNILPYMKAQDWLYNYRLPTAIQRSFNGLARRAAYIKEADTAFDLFLLHYDNMKLCYDDFFPALKSFTIHQLNSHPITD